MSLDTVFRHNRHLLHDLPVLGAQVLQQWARQKYGIRLMIVVIPHTFGRHLNFNCHLHILVSEGGLREDGTAWRARARLDKKALMPMWRYAVITLLREAARAGVLETDAYFAEMDHRFRGCGSRISAKWNARRSVATCVGQLPPIGVATGCRYPTRAFV